MRYGRAIKPISYFKAHAAELIRDVARDDGTIIITQGGEAKAVVLSVEGYEELQDTLAMLKIVALGREEIRRGRIVPVRKAFKRVRATARQR
jgi:prevent-host-death family protein